MLALLIALALPWTAPPPETFLVFRATASRGPHQAGMAYALLASGDGPPGGISGTSGGALNGLLTALVACTPDSALEVDENPLYAVWGDLEWDALFPGDRGCDAYRREFAHLEVACDGGRPYRPGDGLMSSNGLTDLARQLHRRLTEARYRPGCRVPLAFSLVAEDPLPVAIGDATVPAARRTVQVELRADADGRLAICQPAPRPGPDARLRLLLPHAHDGADCQRVEPRTLLEVVQAAALTPPFAPPRHLDYCAADPCSIPGAGGRCAEGLTLCRGRFTDASILDPLPLGAALGLAEGVARPHFIMLDPSAGRAPSPPPYGGVAVVGARFLRPFGTDTLLPVVNDYELQTLRRYGRIPPGARVDRHAGHDRLFGDFAYGAAAFVHPALRRFDFYRGVVDGLRLSARARCRDAERGCLADCWRDLLAKVGADRSPGLSFVLLSTLVRDHCGEGELSICAQWRAQIEALAAPRFAPRVQPFRTLWAAIEAFEARRRADPVAQSRGLRVADLLDLMDDVYERARDGAHPAFDLVHAPFPDFRRWWHDTIRQLAERLAAIELRDGSSGTRRAADLIALDGAVRAEAVARGWRAGGGSLPPHLSLATRLAAPHRVAIITPGGLQVDWDLLSWKGRSGIELTALGAGLHFAADGPTEVETALIGFTPQIGWRRADGEVELGLRLSLSGGIHDAGEPALGPLHAGAEAIFRWRGLGLGVGTASVGCGLACHDLRAPESWAEGPFYLSIGVTDFGGVMYWLLRAVGRDDPDEGAGIGAPDLLGR